jgi:hypothetical protein
MVQASIASIADLITVAQEIIDEFHSNDIWWRGQAQSGWKLQPGVYRDGHDWLYERNVAVRFAHRARSRYQSCPPDTDLPGWLFLAQHYGLKTRLLDWTESPMVATFFAVVEAPDFNADIWMLHPLALNMAQGGKAVYFSPAGNDALPLFMPPLSQGAPQQDKTLAIFAKELDTRMLVQHTAFTIHGPPRPLEDLDNSSDFLRKITISATSKARMVAELDRIGINYSTLFPDLDHLARYISGLAFKE